MRIFLRKQITLIFLYLAFSSTQIKISFLETRRVYSYSLQSEIVTPQTNALRNLTVLQRFLHAREVAFGLDAEGDYFTAVEIRESAHIDLKKKAIHSLGPYKIINSYWTNNIGHLGNLGFYLLGCRLGLVKNEALTIVFNPDKIANLQIFKHFSSAFKTQLRLENSSIYDDYPTQLIQESLETIETDKGFMDQHKFIESVRQHMLIDRNLCFDLDKDEILQGYSFMKSLLKKEYGWFVTLHVRESPQDNPKQTGRVQSVTNYVNGIKLINASGGLVIRIGDNSMQSLPAFPGLLDTTSIPGARDYHLFFLSQCRFFIGTTSGPIHIPTLFGRPTLHTNINAFGRTSWTGLPGSLCLPKNWLRVDTGEQLSLKELLNSKAGYTERPYVDNPNSRIQENSQEELTDAINDMVKMHIHGSSINSRAESLLKVKEIRSQAKAVTFGEISPSYLWRYPNFLKH